MIKGRLKTRHYYVYKSRHKPSHICSKQVPIKFFAQYTALPAKDKPTLRRPNRFDSDSFYIAVDNCASTSFTNNKQDFIGTPRTINGTITGIGKAQAKLQGTVKWDITNDTGCMHAFTIPNVVYNPDLPWRLLSPQHLAQSKSDNTDGTGCITYADCIQLFWDN